MADDHKIDVANGTLFVDGEEFEVADVSFETDGKGVKARPTLTRPPNSFEGTLTINGKEPGDTEQ